MAQSVRKKVAQEVELNGIPASPGIAIGPCYLYIEPTWEPEPRLIKPTEVEREIKRFRNAVKDVHKHIQSSYQEADAKYGRELAELILLQMEILEDRIFLQEVEDVIRNELYDAAYATFRVFKNKKDYFLKLSSDYFRERAFDIQTLKRLILRKLLGYDYSITLKNPAIVVADDLSPSDTVRLHHQKVLGFATNSGGKHSHTAIIARALSVPAVVGLERITEIAKTGDELILDGNHGKVIVNPTRQRIKEFQEEKKLFLSIEKALLKESAQEACTRDGKRIRIEANIEFEEELAPVEQVGVDGIGLFRTEGLFLNRPMLPSEEEQTRLYQAIASKMHPRPVTIRTLDIGGDKLFPDLLRTQEQNPFLGWRAIRFCLDHEEIFLTQLKAILRANVHGNIRIMLPMISTLEEVRRTRELLKRAESELDRAGISFQKEIPLGIMVEIPSVAIQIEDFIQEVDFVSIGTNDLIQYTLAVDRGNEKVAHLYSPFHPAVLRLIQMTIDAGKKYGKPVSMCGEMAGDPVAVPLLLAMGLESFSASHTVIPEIKKIIREVTLEECHQLQQNISTLKTAREITRVLEDFYSKKFTYLQI